MVLPLLLRLLLLMLAVELNGVLALGPDTRRKRDVAGQPELHHGGLTAKHTLYFLSMLPYPDPEPSLNPSIADGPDLFPAVQLAVDHVNNRSDVLRDYHIELIETDGGCDISSKALISLASQLFHSDKQIAGIIGPSCSESAEAVGAMSRRSEIALLSFHQGSSSLLTNRIAYPYSIGMADSPAGEVTGYIDLMKQANWTRVAAIYNIEMLVDYTNYQQFEQEAKDAGIELTLSEVVSETHIPHIELKESYARVIIAFVRDYVATEILCVAYHNNLIYPTYQWILSNGYYVDGNLSFYYQPEGREYNCTEEELFKAGESTLYVELVLPPAADTETVSGLSQEEFFDEYTQKWQIYNNLPYIPYDYPFVDLAYDSVWAMALALNGSLETLQEKNMSLNNYTYGQSNATEVILEHLYQLEFHGVSGLISFNEQTGFTHRQPQYNHIHPLVENSFEAVTIKVAIGLAVVVILVIVVTSVLVAFVHILNTVYENYKTIKASSSRLNHFAYVGCYCVLLALQAYTIVEAFSTSPLATTVLCNFIPWLTSIGFSLVFGTVIVKTWRLYRIFLSSTKHKRRVRIMNKDSFLAVFVVELVVVDVLLCTVWSAVDPLQYRNETNINTDKAIEEVTEMCSSDWFTVWLGLLAAYKTTLLLFAVFLAIITRKIRNKEFKTTKYITLLVYLLFLVTGLGIPVYFITWSLDAQVNISYTILCVVVIALVYLCWGLLFLPPVLPLLREKVLKKPPLDLSPQHQSLSMHRNSTTLTSCPNTTLSFQHRSSSVHRNSTTLTSWPIATLGKR